MFAKSSQEFSKGITNLLRMVRLNAFAKEIYLSNIQNPPGAEMIDLSNKEVLLFLKSLHEHNVRYMLVGGLATVFYGHIRTTQDLDLWIDDTPENRKKLTKALIQLEVPGAKNYQNVDLIPGWSTITIGNHGFVADLMGYTKAFRKSDFEACYKRASKGSFKGVPLIIIDKSDLIKEKETLARPKDLDDVENLKKR